MSITNMKWKDLQPDEAHPGFKEVVIEERIEYGIKRYYPTNELGKKFADLLGTKTLTIGTLTFIIEELDIPVNFKPNEIKFWN
jgi:hypothetical protein